MTTIPGDRRERERFSMSLPVQYTTEWTSGAGRVCNLSHDGIAFSTDDLLPVGAPVTMCVTLPIQRNGGSVQLRLTGEIVRSRPGRSAARVFTRAFRSAKQRFMVAGAGS